MLYLYFIFLYFHIYIFIFIFSARISLFAICTGRRSDYFLFFHSYIYTNVIVKIKGNNLSRPLESSIGDTGILHPRLNLM